MTPAQILGFNAEDKRISINAYAKNGRWQCNFPYAFHRLYSCSGASTRFPGSKPAGFPLMPHLFRRTGHDSMNEQQRVVPVSMTVLFDSSIDYRTLVCCRRIAAYRPRRKKGRIKCDAEKRHSVVGAQKIDEKAGDFLLFDSDGDKNTLSTPSVTKGLHSTRDSLLPHSATVDQRPFFDKSDAAAAGQPERRTRCHDTLVTTSNASYLGTMGRYGSRILRSPTRTQRESPNAKFLCQWHERVVFCFGRFIRITLLQPSINPMTYLSPGDEAALFMTFSIIYLPFLSLSFPARNKQNPTPSRRANAQHPPPINPFSRWLIKLPRLDPFKVMPNHYCPEGCIGGSIPPESRRFSSKFPSKRGLFLLSQLIDLLSSSNRPKFQERFANGQLPFCSLSLILI